MITPFHDNRTQILMYVHQNSKYYITVLMCVLEHLSCQCFIKDHIVKLYLNVKVLFIFVPTLITLI